MTIENYAKTLTGDLSPTAFQKTMEIDLVMEGGIFNGSYLIGCVFYLKQMMALSYVAIDRISACSIGSMTALLFYIENEQVIFDVYRLMYKHFKSFHNIDVFDAVFEQFKQALPGNILTRVNGKLYISYHNVSNSRRVVKKHYNTIDELLDTVRKSCSLPFAVDFNLLYKEKYVDGLYPYVFRSTNAIRKKKRVLYLSLHRWTKIASTVCIKHETSNMHRIFEGLIDMHYFFMSGFTRGTTLCSFVDKWSFIDRLDHVLFVFVLQVLLFMVKQLYFCSNFTKLCHHRFKKHFDVNKTLKCLYTNMLDSYCI